MPLDPMPDFPEFHGRSPLPADPLCGRQTSQRKPCTRKAIKAPVPAPACCWHLTDAERAARDAHVEATRQSCTALRDPDGSPACWAWPITTADRAAVLARGSNAMLVWQEDRCAVCGHASYCLKRDHDHETSYVRGWLCPSCNRAEGTSGSGLFEQWRSRPAAAMFGLAEVYRSAWRGLAEPQPRPGPDAIREAVDHLYFPWGESMTDDEARR